jgi:hypothetical protein
MDPLLRSSGTWDCSISLVSEKVDTILTIVSTLVEDQKDGPTAEKLRYLGLVY